MVTMPDEASKGLPEVAMLPNGNSESPNPSDVEKKSRESEGRRRRRKQKKNKHSGAAAEEAKGTAHDSSKENSNPQIALEPVEVEYVSEKAELDGVLDDEFRKIFERFNFLESSATEESDKLDNIADSAPSKKKDSDSEEEEQDTKQKEKGISNKKKKLQHRMKIAELKQICSSS